MTTLTAIVAACGPESAPWLGPCLESLASPGGVKTVLLITDQMPTEAIRWATAREISMAVLRINENAARMEFDRWQQDPELTSAAKIVAWRAAFHLLPLGAHFVALDVDTLICRPLLGLFEEATPKYFTLAVPRLLQQSGHYYYGSAVLAGHMTTLVDRYVEDWLRERQRAVGQRQRFMGLYGSLESAAWQLMVNRADEAGGIILGTIPQQWCLAHDTPLIGGVQPGIIHFENQLPDVDHGGLGAQWARAKHRSGL